MPATTYLSIHQVYRHHVDDVEERLLAESAELLFRPKDVQDRVDNHRELYLDCEGPEGALSLNNRTCKYALHVCGGGPIEEPLFLHDPNTSDGIIRLPEGYETNAAKYISELLPMADHHAALFLGWHLLTNPSNHENFLEYFLCHSAQWLIGIRRTPFPFPSSPTLSRPLQILLGSGMTPMN